MQLKVYFVCIAIILIRMTCALGQSSSLNFGTVKSQYLWWFAGTIDAVNLVSVIPVDV